MDELQPSGPEQELPPSKEWVTYAGNVWAATYLYTPAYDMNPNKSVTLRTPVD